MCDESWIENGRPMVQCEDCENWYHWHCVGFRKAMEEEEWKCVNCAQKRRPPELEKPGDVLLELNQSASSFLGQPPDEKNAISATEPLNSATS
jgi:hypothetical protein